MGTLSALPYPLPGAMPGFCPSGGPSISASGMWSDAGSSWTEGRLPDPVPDARRWLWSFRVGQSISSCETASGGRIRRSGKTGRTFLPGSNAPTAEKPGLRSIPTEECRRFLREPWQNSTHWIIRYNSITALCRSRQRAVPSSMTAKLQKYLTGRGMPAIITVTYLI